MEGKRYFVTKAIFSSMDGKVKTLGDRQAKKFLIATLTNTLNTLNRKRFRIVSVTIVFVICSLLTVWRILSYILKF